MNLCVRIRGERGNAMVLATMLLLALTSVGVISVQRTNTDLMVAGNVSRAAQASMAGEAGMTHSLAVVADNPNDWTKLLDQQRDHFTSSYRGTSSGGSSSFLDGYGTTREESQRLGLTLLQRSTAIPDPTGTGQPFHVPAVDGTIPLSRIQQDVAYDAEVIHIDEIQGAAGYDVAGPQCFELFDFSARGGIPGGIETVDDTLCARDDLTCRPATVVVESRARVMGGPVMCQRKHGS